ncbi:hypothetical protein JY432_03115 [Stenotrophomonas maltophilia]|nr:hypothetical protein [Stenotrophomonas maltophilia]
MKKLLKWLLLAVIVFFAAMLALGVIINATMSPEEKAAQQAQIDARKAEQAAAAESARVAGEQKAQEAKQAEIAALPVVTARDLASAYEQNTVAADQMYKGKKFKATGEIASISTDFMGRPYLTLRGGVNEFMEPQFIFSKDALDSIAKLKKGDVISAICVGKGDVAKTPMVGDCEFFTQ